MLAVILPYLAACGYQGGTCIPALRAGIQPGVRLRIQSMDDAIPDCATNH
jgi:hypothetical protein